MAVETLLPFADFISSDFSIKYDILKCLTVGAIVHVGHFVLGDGLIVHQCSHSDECKREPNDPKRCQDCPALKRDS